MLIVLPVFVFVLFATLCWRDCPVNERVLRTAVVFGVLVVAMTEALSLASLLTGMGLATLWFCVLLFLLFTRWVNPPKAERSNPRAEERIGMPRLVAISVALIVIPTALIALVAPPNTSDSIVYHLPRVAQWIQNRTVAHFPTSEPRQLYIPPGASFLVLHFNLLANSDRFANMPQWLSMVGSLVGVAAIARLLGGNPPAAGFAVVICVTLPQGILEATSTQTDYVGAFWLVCFVYHALRWQAKADLETAALAGASLGLALLAKPISYLYSVPLILWLAYLTGRPLVGRAWKFAVLAGLIAGLVNLGHYSRNVREYGHPIDPGPKITEGVAGNASFTVGGTVSNISRNLALHMPIPNRTALKDWAECGMKSLHTSLGIDINDPRTTHANTTFAFPGLFNQVHEDTASNLLHCGLIVVTLGLCFSPQVRRQAPRLAPLALALFGGFCLLCFFLRWQPWNTRYHLPLFVIGAPVVGVAFSCIFSQRVLNVLSIGLIVCALPLVVYNATRPLVGRSSILTTSQLTHRFRSAPAHEAPYLKATSIIREQSPPSLGMMVQYCEYPLWSLLQEPHAGEIKLVHVRPALEADAPPPPLIFMEQVKPYPDLTLRISGYNYVRLWTGECLTELGDSNRRFHFYLWRREDWPLR